nr:hypothetical protein [Herpetosiphonaceae bacterium]
VSYSTTSTTATSGSDYTPLNGLLIFPPGTTVQTITLPILEDGLAEPLERLSLRITQATNITFSTQATVVSIKANDTLQVMFPSTTATEVYPNATVYLTLNAPSAQPITVTYRTVDGTALAGQDYVAQLGTATFPPGSTYRYFDLPIIDDTDPEDDEMFSVVLSDPINAQLGATITQTVKIIANDAPTPTPTTAPTPTPLPANSVLFVTGSSVTSSDTAVINRLNSLTVDGTPLNVIVKTHTAVTAADAGNGVRLVLISSSVSSTSVGTTFKTTPVPVMVWEYGLFDDMGMTGTTSGTHFGETAAGTQITISQPGHPLAAGLTGTVSVHSTAQIMSYASQLPASAISVAHVPGTSARSLVWGYETGAAMVGLNAPARRVGFFFYDASASNPTPQSWQLFEAAVMWSLGSGAAPSPTPTSIATATATATATSIVPTVTATSAVPTVTATSIVPTATSTPAAGTVLLVANSLTLNPSDSAIKAMLEGRGYTVVVKAASATVSSDATGKALVLISSTVTSGQVGTKFTTAPVPVIVWEWALYDDMLLTSTAVGTEQGTTEDVSTLSIVNTTHPLAAGLSGTRTVVNSVQKLSFGMPNSNGVVVAQAGGNNRSVLFVYEACALLTNNITAAPARRVGLFLNDDSAAMLTVDGATLLNAALDWALAGSACGAAPTATATSVPPTATGSPVPAATATSVPPTATGSPIPTATATSVPPTATATTIPSATPTTGGAAKTALFVVNNEGSLNAGDTAVRNRLAGLNYTVTVKTASTATASDATGKMLVLISSSVSSGSVADTFKSVTVPVIVWEQAIYDDMAMTGTILGADYGTASASSLTISNPGHALAGGLSGTVTVFTAAAAMPYGFPTANAISLAPQGTSNTKQVYFAYDKNALMSGGFSVNARRVGLFWVDTATPTNEAWTLFEAAVNWATMP